MQVVTADCSTAVIGNVEMSRPRSQSCDSLIISKVCLCRTGNLDKKYGSMGRLGGTETRTKLWILSKLWGKERGKLGEGKKIFVKPCRQNVE